MARILFTCRPLSGHFEPLLPLAEAARSAGHTVAFASGDPVVGRARDGGFEAFTAGPPESFRATWAPRFPGFRDLVADEQRTFFFTEIFANLELVPRARDLESVMAAWSPDLVLHEVAELAAPLVCEELGIDWVDVGFGPLVPLSVLRAAGAATEPQRRAHGLEPDPLGGLFRHLYVDPCPPSLQNAEIDDVGSVQQVRPAAGAAPATDSAWSADVPGRRLRAYVTLGTIWNDDLGIFRVIIDALHDHLDLIVTVGRQNDPDALGPLPSGVTVRRYIPQHEVLAGCDVVVAHGGAGTTLGALAAGLPLLVVPQGADQWSNADRVVAAGAGIRLLRDELSTTRVRQAVMALLDEPSYRRGAERVRDEIEAMPTPDDAIRSLDALL